MASKAMKKTWELFHKAGVKTMEAWSHALRTAWAIVKGLVKETVTVGEINTFAKDAHGNTASLWVKHGLTRVYVNYTTGGGSRKTVGFLKIENGKVAGFDGSREVRAVYEKFAGMELTAQKQPVRKPRCAWEMMALEAD